MANRFDTSDLDVFLRDFGVDANATTWGKAVRGIFDVQYVEFEQISRESPTFLVKTSDIPTTRAAGDRFTINDESFKMVDVQYSEPGMSLLILAAVS